MTSSQKFCTKCGTSNNIDVKFCRNCGEGLSSPMNSATEFLEKGNQVLNNVSSTVSKVESAFNTVAKVGSATDQISKFIVRPPAEWKVVVGEMMPAAGQVIAETAIHTAGQKIQEKVTEVVSEKLDNSGDLSEQISRSTGPIVPENTVNHTSKIPEDPGQFCVKCNSPVISGSKFCKNCGAQIKSPLSDSRIQTSSSNALFCSSCQAPLTNEMKFCKKCGKKVEIVNNTMKGVNSTDKLCPSCGSVAAVGVKFCKNCGTKF